MSFLGHSADDLREKGAIHTAREIVQQPELWLKTYRTMVAAKEKARSFLENVFANRELDVILTGAGSSAFIGKALEGIVSKSFGKRVRAVPTTDIVTHPNDYFVESNPTLLVSFARSGDSPESVAAIEIANRSLRQAYHLIITCNRNGALAQTETGDSSRCLIVLPPEANDRGLAMTGSFTSMLLTGMLVAKLNAIERIQAEVELMASYGTRILENAPQFETMAALDFERAVFLGSGPQLGTALESHLKVQELTDGNVICKHDSFLGFRHGPKAVVNQSTYLMFLLTNDPGVQPYEIDLINATGGAKGLFRFAVMERGVRNLHVDSVLELAKGDEHLPEEYLAVCNALPAQILGCLKSLRLGLRPDAPSAGGAIHRVVQGVTIYPYRSVAR